MIAILRLNNGVLTRKIHIPDDCLHTRYRLVYSPKINLHVMNGAQPLIEKGNHKILEFEWDLKSRIMGVPVLDLVDISN